MDLKHWYGGQTSGIISMLWNMGSSGFAQSLQFHLPLKLSLGSSLSAADQLCCTIKCRWNQAWSSYSSRNLHTESISYLSDLLESSTCPQPVGCGQVEVMVQFWFK